MNKEEWSKVMVYLSLALKIIGIFLGIATIIMLAWKVFGHSPTSESVILFVISILTTLVCALIVLAFNTMYKLGKIETEIKHIKRMMYALARDFREFKNHTH